MSFESTLTKSDSPAKPSTPSRAYLHLTKEEHISLLSDKVRSVTFTDIKGGSKEPALSGPPTVEFAPYARIPNGRARQDLRQGTIDQDQEFINFLESLTNPIVKPAPVDQNNDIPGKNGDKITVTPLVQFLKDKKANKGKDTTPASKGAKHTRHDSKDNVNGAVLEKRLSSKTGNTPLLPAERQNVQAIKIEKATREVVQVIHQQVAEVIKSPLPSPANSATEKTERTPNIAKSTSRTEKTPNIAKTTAGAEKTPTIAKPAPGTEKSQNTAKPAPGTDKKRERGSASAAAKILQRDLGIGTSPRGRGARRGVSSSTPKPTSGNADATVPKEDSSSSSLMPLKESAVNVNHAPSDKEASILVGSSTTASKPQEPTTSFQTPKGPATSRTSSKAATSSDAKAVPQNSSKVVSKDIPVSPTATQAFLKHANASQGITESLLEEAFAGFGNIKKVEIDKKKGFGYIDFTEPKSLQDAIKASPVKVGQGQVVVLERKTGPHIQTRNARGGGSSLVTNRGGSTVNPRGGRGGGGVRRGSGASRGGTNTNILNSNTASKGAATTTSPAQPVRETQAVNSLETKPQSTSEAMPDVGTSPSSTSKPATSDIPDLSAS